MTNINELKALLNKINNKEVVSRQELLDVYNHHFLTNLTSCGDVRTQKILIDRIKKEIEIYEKIQKKMSELKENGLEKELKIAFEPKNNTKKRGRWKK